MSCPLFEIIVLELSKIDLNVIYPARGIQKTAGLKEAWLWSFAHDIDDTAALLFISDHLLSRINYILR